MSVSTTVRKLHRGETTTNFIGQRKRWYIVSGVMVLICLAFMIFRGFNVGIEFEGGSQFQIEVSNTSISSSEAEKAVADTGVEVAGAAQEVGSGNARSILVRTVELSSSEQTTVRTTVAETLKVTADKVNVTTIGSNWGSDVTRKAVTGLIIFLIAIFFYIWIRFTWRMSAAAIFALVHDLILAAGVYSIVGFEVTPSTIVGLLTILGFSLYDTVVVFDKVAENTRNLTAGTRMTYSEAANLAVNQTLMRSINTSLISLLPVGGLLFIGAGVLGVGTLKDLALILFVGLAVGAYSSLFLATPVLCDLTERQPQYRDLTRRVLAKRASEAKSAATRAENDELVSAAPQRRAAGPAPAPRPGARPQRGPSGGRGSRGPSGNTRRR